MKLVITIPSTNQVIGFEYESKEALDAKLRDNCKHISVYGKAIDVYLKEGREIFDKVHGNRRYDYTDEMSERARYIESELDLLHELYEPYRLVTSSCGRYSIPVRTYKSHDYGYSAPLIETVEEYLARLFKEKE